MYKKYLPFILTIFSIIISTYCWDKILLPYNLENQIHGSYALKKYNPNNEIFRFVMFISLPLITFLSSYLILNGSKILSIKEVLYKKITLNQFDNKEKIYNIFVFLFIVILVIEFLSINFKAFSTHIDLFHEGLWLTASNNYVQTNGLWTKSYFARGLFGNFEPLILWNIFNVDTIGSSKFLKFILLLFNKILLILLAKEISKNLLFSKKIKIYFFIILSILLISLVDYDGSFDVSEFPTRLLLFLLFFLLFFKSLYKRNEFSFLFFLLGLFSIVSMLWYIDIGAYINVILLFIIIYFLIRLEFIKCSNILFGVFSGWIIFFLIIPSNEFFSFISNTISLYLSMDYIQGLIYPTPFMSNDSRSTRALLLIILSGIFVIIINFNKEIKLSYYNKTFLLFIFIGSLLVFKTGLSRSDTPHIRTSSGFTLFLIYTSVLYFIFYFLTKNKKINLKLEKFNFLFQSNFKNLIIIFLCLSILVFKTNLNNLKNLLSFKNQVSNLIYNGDEKYLSNDYKDLIKYYKKLSEKDNCIQILTNETAIPYLLKKPTCTQFYLIWSAGPTDIQNKFVDQLKQTKPKIILYKSDVDPYDDTFQRIPIVNNYVKKNYSFHSKFKFWTFMEIN